MAHLRFYNTLRRQVEDFSPLVEGQVRIYTCGPTVYDRPHIGNLRTFLFEDLLRRTLKFCGLEVEQVMNLTDVEDKIIARSQERGVSLDDFTTPHIEAFFADLESLGFEPVEHYPRATRYVAEMIEMVERLLASGHAYESDGCVFFRIASFADYGQLSGIDLTQVRQGERVAADEYGKDDARDFVLWKAAKEGEPAWDSPFGSGRPGWHLECSAMSRALLGDSFDIHCGGVDNIFPHHENEIAQSVCANQKPFVRFWLHAEHLLVDGKKMSKSLGNQYTLSDLIERGIPPRAVRYLFLSVHYRKKLNFTFDSVATASTALQRLDQMQLRLEQAAEVAATPTEGGLVEASEALLAEFGDCLADDLNSSGALGALFKFSHEVNRRVDDGVSTEERAAVRAALHNVDRVLGVLDRAAWEARSPATLVGSECGLDDDAIEELVARRSAARSDRDFAEADRVRDQLVAAGVSLEDGPQGTRWRRL